MLLEGPVSGRRSSRQLAHQITYTVVRTTPEMTGITTQSINPLLGSLREAHAGSRPAYSSMNVTDAPRRTNLFKWVPRRVVHAAIRCSRLERLQELFDAQALSSVHPVTTNLSIPASSASSMHPGRSAAIVPQPFLASRTRRTREARAPRPASAARAGRHPNGRVSAAARVLR